MNRTCNGHFFADLNLYRCLQDGQFVSVLQSPDICPNCKRAVIAKDIQKSKVRTKQVTEVYVPNIGYVPWTMLTREDNHV